MSSLRTVLLGITLAFLSTRAGPAAAGPTHSQRQRRAKFTNGLAFFGSGCDILMAASSMQVYPDPKDTREEQVATGFGAFSCRTYGVGGALLASRHLKHMETPVSRGPVLGSLGMTVATFAYARSTWPPNNSVLGFGPEPEPRPPNEQAVLAIMRMGAGGLVGWQAYMNRQAIRSLDPQSNGGPSFRLFFGIDRLGVEGQF